MNMHTIYFLYSFKLSTLTFSGCCNSFKASHVLMILQSSDLAVKSSTSMSYSLAHSNDTSASYMVWFVTWHCFPFAADDLRMFGEGVLLTKSKLKIWTPIEKKNYAKKQLVKRTQMFCSTIVNYFHWKIIGNYFSIVCTQIIISEINGLLLKIRLNVQQGKLQTEFI